MISSVLETIGDYHACAHLSHAPPPPPHAVNRGVLLEGLGSVISGAMGAGHATTSSTGSLVLVNISKVLTLVLFCLFKAIMILYHDFLDFKQIRILFVIHPIVFRWYQFKFKHYLFNFDYTESSKNL